MRASDHALDRGAWGWGAGSVSPRFLLRPALLLARTVEP